MFFISYKKIGKIYLTYGEKGTGKSLDQATIATKLFKEYAKTEKKYPHLPKRIYFGNQKFNEEIEKRELGIHLYYWTNAKQLRWCPRQECWETKKYINQDNPNGKHPIHDADIAHDEISKDIPASSWADTPPWFRQLFSHLRKRGNRYFANTQVFEDIDIAFRRQIDQAFMIRKVFGSSDLTATRPAPKLIFGLIVKVEFDPRLLEWERDPEERELKNKISRFPTLIWISRKKINIYNTKDEIPPYKPDTLEHHELFCEDPNCEKHGKIAGKPKVEHYKI